MYTFVATHDHICYYLFMSDSFSSLKLCHGNLFLRKREHTNTPTGHKCLMLEIIQPNFYELLTIIHMYRVILISIFVPDTYYALLQLYFSEKNN